MTDIDITPAMRRTLADLQATRRIPRATYRFQFNKDFTFQQAEALVEYLGRLGVSDLYSSPLLKAVPGSMHGYDICDHSQLNPELGSPDDFERLITRLHEHGMGLLLDVVPNHMGIEDNCNAWWQDVLENGLASRYAHYFDISWYPLKPELAEKVLLPLLEDQYGNVLISGKLALAYDNGGFVLNYGPYSLPIAPRSYERILNNAVPGLTDSLGADNESVQELQSIITAVGHLPRRMQMEPEQRDEREREKAVIRRRLTSLMEASPAVKAALEDTLRVLNGVPGDARSFDLLDEILLEQAYRLAFWRVAGEEINYRRFFDINTMAAIRTELPDVFDDTHALIFDLIARGAVTGLRVDHPDGLWNPADYFHRLQERFIVDQLGEETRAAVNGWLSEQAQIRKHVDWPLYVVAEKILSESEPLPFDWAVDGTTGYDFMNIVNGIFVNSDNERAFTDLYGDFTGFQSSFHDLEYTTKKMVMQESLASEINSLARQLERISERNRNFRDFTLNGLLYAIREFIACLKIYRTYTTGPDSVAQRDQQFVEAAAREAEHRNPHMSRAIFAFLRDTLLLRNLYLFRPEDQPQVLQFVMRFQQISGPVTAKSVEDTSFYIYNRLVSLNEVGGSPADFGLPVETFHTWNTRRMKEWPHAMVSLSTHDTKRSEDVRARLNVLSEIPDEWRAALETWRDINADLKTSTDDGPAPDANDEYLLYQTLLGAWPLDALKNSDDWTAFRERIAQYIAKATHEAKVHTSWTNPDEAYDQGLRQFVDAVVTPDNTRFLDAFLPFQRRVAFYGQFNSLSQTLLKLTVPGVPDTYRGTEVWDFSLVDPDNRRPVDYDRILGLLDDLQRQVDQGDYDLDGITAELMQMSASGRIKLYVVTTALSKRARQEGAIPFEEGAYTPLFAKGSKADHICALVRGTFGGDVVITVVPRLVVGLMDGQQRLPVGRDVWEDTWLELPDTALEYPFVDVLTGNEIAVEAIDGVPGLRLADVLSQFPVALLSQKAV